MNESTFTRAYMKNIVRQFTNMTWFKIPDPQGAMGQGQMTGTRYVDVVAFVNGRGIAMEWKLQNRTKDNRALKIEKVRDSQIEVLRDVERSGNIGLLMIGQYRDKDNKSVYIIPIEEWIVAVNTTTLKSIRIEEAFPQFETRMHWKGGLLQWDITPIQARLNYE